MSHRIERVNQLLRKEISELLQREVNDPRLSAFISINDVETTADLKHAKIFISHLDDNADVEELLTTLKSASGFLRSELARRCKMRYIPELTFYWDDSIKRGVHLVDILDNLQKTDKQD